MLDNGWRMSIPMLQTKIECQCKHCPEWMGEEHDYNCCYKNKKGFKLICSEDLQKRYPLDMCLYQELSNKF